MEHTPIRFHGEKSFHHVLVYSDSSVPRKFNSEINQARRTTKEGLSAISINLLAGILRNTQKNNVDNTAMTKELEKFQSKFEDQFLSFAVKQLDKDTYWYDQANQKLLTRACCSS